MALDWQPLTVRRNRGRSGSRTDCPFRISRKTCWIPSSNSPGGAGKLVPRQNIERPAIPAAEPRADAIADWAAARTM